MHVFIGGAHAGRRRVVARRFAAAAWLTAEQALELPSPPSGQDLVVTGWDDWIDAALATHDDDDRLRTSLAEGLEALCRHQAGQGAELILILSEMGRGVVPLAVRDRRLRDLSGWLAQDAAARAEWVWYVRHGLVQSLKWP